MKRYRCHSRKASVVAHSADILSGAQRSRRTPSQVIPRAPSTSLGMTETGPASIFLLLEPFSICTTIVKNEIQIRRGDPRCRPQWSRVGRLSGARGVKRSAPGEERLHRRRYYVAKSVPRLRCPPLALLVPGQPLSRENYSRLGTEPR